MREYLQTKSEEAIDSTSFKTMYVCVCMYSMYVWRQSLTGFQSVDVFCQLANIIEHSPQQIWNQTSDE